MLGLRRRDRAEQAYDDTEQLSWLPDDERAHSLDCDGSLDAVLVCAECARQLSEQLSDGDWEQVGRALHLLRFRQSLPDVVERAAVVLLADPAAPVYESVLGGPADDELTGQKVRCRNCKRRWELLPWETLLNAEGKTGTCVECFMTTESRPDAQTPETPALAARVVESIESGKAISNE